MDDLKKHTVYCAEKNNFNWRLKALYFRYIAFIVVVYNLLYIFNVFNSSETLSILINTLFHFTLGFFTYHFFMKKFKFPDISSKDLE